MKDAKIRLSQKEMELLLDAGIILTKNDILNKAMLLLGDLQNKQNEYVKTRANSLPAELIRIPPKISKGEHYRGLPYLILDYPRMFEKENIFAIRTMIWWGHFFSITLHLSGQYKKKYESKLDAAWQVLKDQGFFYCINKNEWEHHFEEDNYIPVAAISPSGFSKVNTQQPFLKLSQKIPLGEWENATDLLFRSFKILMEILVNQLPSR